MLQLKLLLTIITISFLSCGFLHAQHINENDFTLYTRQKGLSDNNITGLAQDSAGFMWIATSAGLNRFNGSVFEQFHSNNEKWSLPSEHIYGMHWIDKFRLVTFGDGLHIIDTRKTETSTVFIPYKDKEYQYKFNWIISVTTNKNLELFVLARSGFYHFNSKGELLFRFDYYKENEVATTAFSFGRFILQLDEEKLAIVSEDGVYFYNSATRKFGKMQRGDFPQFSSFINYSKSNYQFYQVATGRIIILEPLLNKAIYADFQKNSIVPFNIPRDVMQNEFDYRSSLTTINDSLFYITSKTTGFFQITLNTQKQFVTFNPEKLFNFETCRHLLLDRENTLWIGTTTGLLHENKTRKAVFELSFPESILKKYPATVIDGICKVGNKLCVATRGYAGLLLFDKELQFLRRIGFENSFRKPDNIYALSPLDKENLMVAANGPLYKVNILNGKLEEIKMNGWDRENDWIADLCKDPSGNIWIASEKLYKYSPAARQVCGIETTKNTVDKIEWIQRIEQDSSGNIWMAGHGLVRYNIQTGKQDLFLNNFPFIKIPDKQVNSFKIDNRNNLWVNTNNNGLACYNINSHRVRLFTRDDGLPDNNIASMLLLKNQLWIATFSGIACLNLSNFQIKSYGVEDGFPQESISIGSKFFYDESSNKIFIGFKNKIVQFDPDLISANSKPPQFFIQSIAPENKMKITFPGDSYTTSWKNKDITLSLGTINFSTGATQRFAYKLDEDTSDAWQWLGENNTFTISNLSPGKHTIGIKLYSIANRWPQQLKTFSIELLPPYWQKTWFKVLCICIILISLYVLYKWQTGIIQKKERTKTAFEKLKAEEYKSQ
ncbi:MAG TPA: two-component regulator propeller domain-containing protein, partial [Flavisolibacter sp.]|nr:two-component regulator propeller domain-containing protein [Flavisolibacter sp.]